MRKWVKTYIASLRKDIVILLILDCVFLLIMELVLKRIPAPFPIFVKVGNVAITLGISFLASFVFYFVQVHMPETRQKKDLYPIIAELFHRIINNEKEFLTNMVGEKSYNDLTEDNIRFGINSRDVNIKNAPLYLAGPERNADWMEYGFYQVTDIDKSWEMLMKYSAYMESEFLSMLSKIQSDTTIGFFRTMKGIYPTFRHGLHLRGFEDGFVRLWKSINGQEKYYQKVFAEYKI